VATLLAPAAVRAQVQFPVGFEASAAGLNSTERAQLTSHAQAAGRFWVAELDLSGARSIEVVIGIDDARPTAGGSSVTSAFVANAAGRDIFEQGAAGELRTGTDPNGATADIRIVFNTNYLRNELWFDPAPLERVATVPANRTDAMSVLLHEFGHALAYNGFANLADGQPPATFWSTFDRWMIPGPPLPVRFSGPRAVASFGSNPELTTNNIFHWGNAVQRMPAAASATTWVFEQGRPRPQPPLDEPVSVDRVDPTTALRLPQALLDELMNGVVFIRGSRYAISPLDRAALADAGLPVALFRNGFE
jgi:hypothetical protein